MGEAVDEEGVARARGYEGLGRDVSRADVEELAWVLKERAVRELRKTWGVTDAYESVEIGPGEAVVHDLEGTK